MHNYTTTYEQLNKQQQLAVNTIEGPLLVVAGPGTGKTQLLSMRVANILRTTDASPNNILCLTFTNKAATNMRERLVGLIGPEAHGVQVKTFHSFAADIMATHPDYFWNGARLTSAPDAVQLSIIQEILSQLPLDNPLALRFAGMYTATADVQNGLKLVKEAGLTAAKLRALIDANLAYLDVIEPLVVELLSPTLSVKKLVSLVTDMEELPEQSIDNLIQPLLSLRSVLLDSLEFAVEQDQQLGKTTHTGAWKRRWIQTVDGQKGMHDERRRNNWWLALAHVYEAYKTELNRRGYYDYADMVVEVISQLEQSADLRAAVQEQYLYVLIDEFQDTNAGQLRLAHLVADHHLVNDNPNLMAVGDDDQSIFKFNGAELNNMLSFRRSYPSAQLVVLTKNYRSSQAVLNNSREVIEQAEDRLVKREPSLDKTLLAVNSPKESGTIQQQQYPTQQHQFTLVAEQIARRWQEHPDVSVAILARSHGSLRSVAAALLSQDIPIRYEQQQNILDHEAVDQALQIMQAVVALGTGDQSALNQTLAKLVRHPMWDISPKVLWKLALDNYSNPDWLTSLQSDKKLEVIAHWLLWLGQESSYQPLPVMFEYILGLRPSEHMSSPIHDYFTEPRDISSSYLETLSAIHLLRGLVHEFSLGTKPTLSDFVNFVRLNRDNGKIIADQSWFVSGSNAVELLTVHKAKGLEFDTVYIIDAVEDQWQPRKSGRKPPANLPLQPYGDDYDDYVRLMYVAMTRAKHSIILTSYATNQAGDAVLPTPLIHHIPATSVASIDEAENTRALQQAIGWPRLESTDEKQLLSSRLESYQLSVTSLLNFLDVPGGGPNHFFERNLLRLPEAKTPSLAFGTAMHSALEVAQKLANQNTLQLGRVLTAYEEALNNENIPREVFDRYLPHGQQTLQHLFKDLEYVLFAGNKPEQPYNNIAVGDARIGGKLDRIDTTKDGLIIVDYKTGQPLASFETRDKNKMVKAWKHKLQLIFYSLLVNSSGTVKPGQSVTGQMVYVEAMNRKELVRSYTPTPEDQQQLEKLIQAVWKHIMTLDFPDTEHYPAGMEGINAFIDDLLNNKI